MKRYRELIVFIIILLLSAPVSGFDRRREQFTNETNYVLLPAPYSIPGLGSGVMLVGYLGNIWESYADLLVTQALGDIEGYVYGLREVHLIEKRWFFDVFQGKFSKAGGTGYNERGMKSDPDDYNILETTDINFQGLGTYLSFAERQFELSYQYAYGGATFDRILDKDGNVLAENINEEATFKRFMYGLKLDLTDDLQDPHRGIRLLVTRENYDSEGQDDFYSTQYVQDVNLTIYIPIGKISTWAFNYYSSDAHIVKEGETDITVIKNRLGFAQCAANPITQTTCETAVTQRATNTLADNQYGTANNLGGVERLRGYPQNRFTAAHQRFYGTEFRWNFNDEYSPFDLFFIKDIRTGVQLAAFYETATSADIEAELGNTWKSDYGVGLRIVTRSGFVYRFDYAAGEEGNNFSAFFNYPWEGF